MTRKAIPKQVRQQVYDKCNGHCAYCGCKLDIKDMQVDHIESVYRAEYNGKDEDNTIDNYMPACRACNLYKGAMNIDEFRNRLNSTLQNTCRDSFQVKLAMKYGMLTYQPWNGRFYFEKINELEETQCSET